MKKKFLWVDQYAPKIIDDCVLSQNLKSIFNGIVDNKNIPNMILAGSPGTGKTTVARILCQTIECDYQIINASENRNIDLVRVDIEEYAVSNSMSSSKHRKMLILDEADFLNSNTQFALRNQIEKYSNNCGFILTCNYPHKIIPALHSRCDIIDFSIEKSEQQELLKQFIHKIVSILKSEEIEFNIKVVANICAKLFPDFRRIINKLQIYSNSNKKIDEGFLSMEDNTTRKELKKFLKERDFNKIRSWVVENTDGDFTSLSRDLYDSAPDLFASGQDLAQFILLAQKYQYENSFSIDKEIHILAFLVEVMATCKIK